jgi:hypothetical protein
LPTLAESEVVIGFSMIDSGVTRLRQFRATESQSTSAAMLNGHLRASVRMLNERRIERHQLPYYLQVFNRYTDRPMGCLGNVSEQGLMLISDLPILVGADFQLRLKVPDGKSGLYNIDIDASCLWCQEDETPRVFDSGFRLQAAPAEYFVLIQALQRYFSFYSLEASA